MMDIKGWLEQRGITEAQFEELPVIRDIGAGLLLSLQNEDDMGEMLVAIMQRQDALEQRIAKLEGVK